MPQKAHNIILMLASKNLKISTAESCTGGLLSGALTAIPGSSACFGYGLVTYSNEAKEALLNVPAGILAQHGAVSAETAAAMAAGVRQLSGSDIGISVTGIAGPGGATAEKPVGLVYFGYSSANGEITEGHIFTGNRAEVRQQSVDKALEIIERMTTNNYCSGKQLCE